MREEIDLAVVAAADRDVLVAVPGDGRDGLVDLDELVGPAGGVELPQAHADGAARMATLARPRGRSQRLPGRRPAGLGPLPGHVAARRRRGAAPHGAPMTAPVAPRAPHAARPVPRPAASPLGLALLVALVLAVVGASAASAAPIDPAAPTAPTDPAAPAGPDPSVTVDLNGVNGTPSSSIVVLLALTVLSVAPALLLMMTSFTKIFVVLALTRNALGLTGVPPNQVLAGLALFLSLFIMAPVLQEVNTIGVQPYLAGSLTFTQAVETGLGPLREFMLGQTREEDLALMTRAADLPNPESPETVPTLTLIPAFMLSELRSAFIIGFVIFVPFLVIDIVVSAALMSMGMMMLPPVTVSLPFKLLLFVLVDGWGLIVTALVGSYRGGCLMDTTAVLDIGLDALVLAAKLCAPILVTALVIGFAVSLLQSITQIQEVTLSFVPKAIGVSVALLVAGHWMIAETVSFTQELFGRIPGLLGGG